MYSRRFTPTTIINDSSISVPKLSNSNQGKIDAVIEHTERKFATLAEAIQFRSSLLLRHKSVFPIVTSCTINQQTSEATSSWPHQHNVLQVVVKIVYRPRCGFYQLHETGVAKVTPTKMSFE